MSVNYVSGVINMIDSTVDRYPGSRFLFHSSLLMLALMLSAICSNCLAANILKQMPVLDSGAQSDYFASQSYYATEDDSFVTQDRFNPLQHHLESGIKVKGIRLSESLFLVRQKQLDGHTGVGLSLSSNDILYQISHDKVSMTLRF